MNKLRLQRLNMDNTWVVKLGDSSILIDPWLHGNEVDYFKWFNTQRHRTKPIEYEAMPSFDFVLITQKYPDHFHKETLLRLNPKKLIVPPVLMTTVKKMLPDAEVLEFKLLLENVFQTKVSVHHFPTDRMVDPIYDSFVLEDGQHSVFVSTHGHSLNSKALTRLEHLPKVALLLSPFNFYKLPFFLGGVVAPGIDGVAHLIEKLNPKFVVATHDEDKIASGIVSKFAKVIPSPKPAELIQHELFKKSYLAVKDYAPVDLEV